MHIHFKTSTYTYIIVIFGLRKRLGVLKAPEDAVRRSDYVIPRFVRFREMR